jgi:NAD(P)-dependent dehydrogenase (short-subunit alcohol dehydrogenase family)
MTGLNGKNALVTGGASGIGEATALGFAAEGVRVVIADVNADKGQAVAGGIVRDGGQAVFVSCDVTDFDQVGAAVKTSIDQWGSIDILMNNAGIGPAGDTLLEIEPEKFDRIIDTNLRSVYYGMKHAVPAMIKQGGGSIINTASVGALPGIVGGLAYGAAKAAVVRMTMEVASLHGPDNIRVNAILPGLTITPMTIARSQGLTDEQRKAEFAKLQPLPRAIEAVDIANAALWLASDQGSLVTGQAITVDGGLIMSGWGNKASHAQ